MNRPAAILALLTLSLSGCAKHPAPAERDAGPGLLQLSFEVIPGNGFGISTMIIDTRAASYDAKERFTAEVLRDVVPGVLDAVSLGDAAAEPQLTPGGYQLATSPSVQLRGPMEPEVADRLAAALGWTTFQWSVLLTDLGEPDGGTGWAAVTFAGGAPDAALAQSFFEHAARADPGLSGGYTVWDQEMIFLNLRDDAGAPYSGLDDDDFTAELRAAARSFDGARLSAAGELRAWLVGNDWAGSAPEGEDYAARLSADEERALAPLRQSYLRALETTGNAEGWITWTD